MAISNSSPPVTQPPPQRSEPAQQPKPEAKVPEAKPAPAVNKSAVDNAQSKVDISV